MKAITIWQPYASLLVLGEKQYETRSWSTSYRGPIAIHAAKRPARQIVDALAQGRIEDKNAARLMERLLRPLSTIDQLPTGAIIGTARLVRCNFISLDFVPSLSPQEMLLGDFTVGRYAWEFEDMTILDTPHPSQRRPRPMGLQD